MINSSSGRQIIIIGTGVAGLSAAKAARTQDPEAEIIMFGEENLVPYYRLRLCEFIGKSADFDGLKINDEEWFKKIMKLTKGLTKKNLIIPDLYSGRECLSDIC